MAGLLLRLAFMRSAMTLNGRMHGDGDGDGEGFSVSVHDGKEWEWNFFINYSNI